MACVFTFEGVFFPDLLLFFAGWDFWGRKTIQKISTRTIANPIMN